MTAPLWVTEILDRFDTEVKPHSEAEISEELSREDAKRSEAITEEDRKGLLAEHSVFFLREIPEGTSVWGTYFGPMGELTQGDKTIYLPNIRELEPQVIEYWGQNCRRSSILCL